LASPAPAKLQDMTRMKFQHPSMKT